MSSKPLKVVMLMTEEAYQDIVDWAESALQGSIMSDNEQEDGLSKRCPHCGYCWFGPWPCPNKRTPECFEAVGCEGREHDFRDIWNDDQPPHARRCHRCGSPDPTFHKAITINDKIDEWHKSDSKQTLAEYLGFTPQQYAFYVEGDLKAKSRV